MHQNADARRPTTRWGCRQRGSAMLAPTRPNGRVRPEGERERPAVWAESAVAPARRGERRRRRRRVRVRMTFFPAKPSAPRPRRPASRRCRATESHCGKPRLRTVRSRPSRRPIHWRRRRKARRVRQVQRRLRSRRGQPPAGLPPRRAARQAHPNRPPQEQRTVPQQFTLDRNPLRRPPRERQRQANRNQPRRRGK